MKLILLTTPTILPVTLESIKEYLKVLDDNQDAQIKIMAMANISRAEDITNLVLMGVSSFQLTLDSFKDFTFPKNPVLDVEKVEYQDENGVLKILDAGKYHVDNNPTQATLEFHQISISATKIIVTFLAGFETIDPKIALWLSVKVYEDFYNILPNERSKHIDNFLDSMRIIPI